MENILFWFGNIIVSVSIPPSEDYYTAPAVMFIRPGYQGYSVGDVAEASVPAVSMSTSIFTIDEACAMADIFARIRDTMVARKNARDNQREFGL